MAITQVGICNSALAKIGAARISSITEDTKSAIILNSIWDQIRDEVLRSHPWNHSVKRVSLTPNGDTPAWGYDYTYDLPNDCLRVLKTEDEDLFFGGKANSFGGWTGEPSARRWVVEGRKILTDSDTLNIIYIYQNTDPSLWDAYFAEALAWRLAMELAYALVQSVELFKNTQANYERTLALARSVDGMEGTIDSLVADVWSRARI